MAAGSKQKRGKDTWLLSVHDGVDWRGKVKRYTKTVHGSSAFADRELAKFYSEVKSGKVVRSGAMTIETLADEYVQESASRQLKLSSLNSVKTAIKIWIKPYLGSKKLNRIKKIDIQQWVNAMTMVSMTEKA